jgi:hypothetical protein
LKEGGIFLLFFLLSPCLGMFPIRLFVECYPYLGFASANAVLCLPEQTRRKWLAITLAYNVAAIVCLLAWKRYAYG